MARTFVPSTLEKFASVVKDANIYYLVKEGDYSKDELDEMSTEQLLMEALTSDWGGFTKKLAKDIGKVQFDFENCNTDLDGYYKMPKDINLFIGAHTLPNGLNFIGVEAGGDWEQPVYFIIYYDGTSIRGYIPENGNTYNKEFKTAYGSEPDNDGFTDKHGPVPEPDFALMIKDIEARIQRV